MDKEKIIDIIKNVKDKSNSDLFNARDILIDEHEKTKNLIIDLTRHLDSIEEYYETINNEIGNRVI